MHGVFYSTLQKITMKDSRVGTRLDAAEKALKSSGLQSAGRLLVETTEEYSLAECLGVLVLLRLSKSTKYRPKRDLQMHLQIWRMKLYLESLSDDMFYFTPRKSYNGDFRTFEDQTMRSLQRKSFPEEEKRNVKIVSISVKFLYQLI